MVKILLTILAALVLALLSPWLITTPAGPAVVAVALMAQAQAREPAYAPASLLIDVSSRELLASLLAREV